MDLTRIGLVSPQCECGVLPLYYKPIYQKFVRVIECGVLLLYYKPELAFLPHYYIEKYSRKQKKTQKGSNKKSAYCAVFCVRLLVKSPFSAISHYPHSFSGSWSRSYHFPNQHSLFRFSFSCSWLCRISQHHPSHRPRRYPFHR